MKKYSMRKSVIKIMLSVGMVSSIFWVNLPVAKAGVGCDMLNAWLQAGAAKTFREIESDPSGCDDPIKKEDKRIDDLARYIVTREQNRETPDGNYNGQIEQKQFALKHLTLTEETVEQMNSNGNANIVHGVQADEFNDPNYTFREKIQTIHENHEVLTLLDIQEYVKKYSDTKEFFDKMRELQTSYPHTPFIIDLDSGLTTTAVRNIAQVNPQSVFSFVYNGEIDSAMKDRLQNIYKYSQKQEIVKGQYKGSYRGYFIIDIKAKTTEEVDRYFKNLKEKDIPLFTSAYKNFLTDGEYESMISSVSKNTGFIFSSLEDPAGDAATIRKIIKKYGFNSLITDLPS